MIHLHEHRYPYLEEVNEGVLKHVPEISSTGASALDVGCGTGALAEAIKGKGYSVWGIESNEEAVAIAKERIDRVIVADLCDNEAVKSALGSEQFDLMIFSDVLEHVYDPLSVLNFYLPYLKTNSLILVSVPNAVVWTNRLSFLLGRFNYADTGAMDRTHIRFFTFKTADALMGAAGITIRRVDYTPYVIRAFLPVIKRLMGAPSLDASSDRRLLIDSPLYALYLTYVYPVEYYLFSFWKSLFAFRIVIVGQKT